MIKIIEPIPPRPGISLQEFHDYWRHPHGTMALNLRLLRRFFQCHRIDSAVLGPNTTPYEGVAEVWFDSVSQAKSLFSDPYYATHVHPDNSAFADVPGLLFLWAEEEVIQGRCDRLRGTLYDQEWSENNRALGVKLFQFVVADSESPWSAEEDLELGLRINAFRHIRSHSIEADGPFLGSRELFWPTLTAFEQGVAADPEAFALLRDRPRKSFLFLAQTERII